MPALNSVALTAEQEKLWSDTTTMLLWSAPAFTHVWYTMMQNTGNKDRAFFTKDVPYAATDGSNMIINPETFFKWNLQERTFVAAHEILHCIFNHVMHCHNYTARGTVDYPDGTSLPYDAEQMNKAMDYVINAILVESNLGTMPVIGCFDLAIATAMDGYLATYKKIYKKPPAGNPPSAPGGFDQIMEPGSSTNTPPSVAAQQHNPTAWEAEIKAGMDIARATGKLPAGLDRALSDALTPTVDWKDKIRALFNRKVGSGGFDWKRPDRRLIVREIYAPGRSGFGAGDVVVGVDTSGSIGIAELNMFFAEMSGILEDVKPKRLVVMWCDAEIGRVDELEESSDLETLRKQKAPGGGGTSFIPVFEKIAEMGLNPEALVYLTDGMGSFPDRAPSYPVIWGSIYEAAKYPFGDVVNIPPQAA